MHRSIRISLLLLSIILSSSAALACVSFPRIETKSNCTIEFTYDNFQNRTLISRILEENRARCGFQDKDLPIIIDFVANGYWVKEQDAQEYSDFLHTVKQENAKRPADCPEYRAVAHKGIWTGYLLSGYEYFEHGGCAYPDCAGAAYHIILNDLRTENPQKTGNTATIIFSILGGIIILSLILSIYYKKSRSS